MSDISVGSHNNGLFPFGDKVKATPLEKDLLVDQAVAIAKANPGTELLIEKKNEHGVKTYDLYELNVNKAGKSLETVEFIENVTLKPQVAKQFSGDRAIVAAEDKKQNTTFWQVRERDPISELKWTAEAVATNTKDILQGKRPQLPLVLPQIALDERIELEAEKAAKGRTCEE